MFFSLKQGLAILKHFFVSQWQFPPTLKAVRRGCVREYWNRSKSKKRRLLWNYFGYLPWVVNPCCFWAKEIWKIWKSLYSTVLGMIKKMFCCWRSEMLKIIKKFGLCLSQLKLEFSIFHILWLCENSRLVNCKSTIELDWLRNEVDVPAIVCLGESPLNLAGSGPIIFTSCGTSRPPKQGRSSTSDEKSIYKMSGKNSTVRVQYSTVHKWSHRPGTCFDPSKWARV